MNQINTNGKIIQLRCCKCKDTNGPFIGDDPKKLYCEPCHKKMILEASKKNVATSVPMDKEAEKITKRK